MTTITENLSNRLICLFNQSNLFAQTIINYRRDPKLRFLSEHYRYLMGLAKCLLLIALYWIEILHLIFDILGEINAINVISHEGNGLSEVVEYA